ncbi:tyrosine-type recombinase/integrase [Ornithinibacillus californiensis]|uniref:tyrosine-type recombinase/integrase n=1 Tax=Ornithinibacillus californiensis TaxID=161536 RepID=UPI00064DE703|nr:tyrosine-type recombinase/integrase [Ornithinibacillus californiensis]
MTIRIVKENKYQVIYDQGKNQFGKRMLRSKVFNTLKEAEEFKANLLQNEDTLFNKSLKVKSKYNQMESKEPWSYTEAKQFLELAEKENKDVLYDTVLYTGLRLGEVCTLSWDDVNLMEGTLTVKRYIERIGSGQYKTFTYRIPRTIQLPAHIINKLDTHMKKQEQWKIDMGDAYNNGFSLVFPNKNGTLMKPISLNNQFELLIKKAGVRKISFHGLRRTHNRFMIQKTLNKPFFK